MRKLMWISAGFCAACAVGAYLFSGSYLLIFGVCLLLIAVGALLQLKKESRWRAAAFALLGLALGMIWFPLFGMLTLSPAKNADGQQLILSAEASDYSYSTDYGTAVEAVVELDGKQFKSKLYLDDSPELQPGDRVEGEFLLAFTGPEGEEASTYHSGSGLFLLCYQQGQVSVEDRNDQSLIHLPARIRRQILQTIENVFPGDTAAFAKALLLGDTTDISYETDTALTASGIVHIVSVSGLHVSILFSLLFILLGRRRLLTPLAGVGLLFFAAAVTGFSPSIVRACLMNGLMLLALMMDREYDGLTALGFAMIVMLGVNPLAITSVGLQLSAASVLGINLFSVGIGEWIRDRMIWGAVKRRTLKFRLREWLASTVSVSLSATILTAPLTAVHFGSVSLVGLLTNLLVLWAVNAVFIVIIFAVLLGLFWLPAAKVLAWGLSWGIRFVLLVADMMGSFPLAAVYTESVYIGAWLVFCYLMLAAFLLMRRKRVLQLTLCAVVTLLIAVGISYAEPRLDEYRITVIDVGQGQCVLLQSEGRTYMVDCGGSDDEDAADKAVATLYAQGVFRLDGLILTHYDRDHVGGAQYLLSRMQVDRLYLPVGPGQAQWEQEIVSSTDAQLLYVQEDVFLRWKGAALSIFASDSRETSNESSLCVLFQKENYDILITGDRGEIGEMNLLVQEQIPRLDALVVGHHGSDSSTSEYLLKQTMPDVALISVGEGNAYGHPTREVLERLEACGCIIRRTDREGTIIIRG